MVRTYGMGERNVATAELREKQRAEAVTTSCDASVVNLLEMKFLRSPSVWRAE